MTTRGRPKRPVPDAAIIRIQQEVADKHGLPVGVMWSPARTRRASNARKEAIVRIIDETGATYQQIGRHFNRSHSAIIYLSMQEV